MATEMQPPDNWFDGESPPDLVDRIDPDLREKLIHEATADMVPAVWLFRRQRFLSWLDSSEHVWFG